MCFDHNWVQKHWANVGHPLIRRDARRAFGVSYPTVHMSQAMQGRTNPSGVASRNQQSHEPTVTGLLRGRLVAVLVALVALCVSPQAQAQSAPAPATERSPLLFLGIQRAGGIDRVGTQLVVEHLLERGEDLMQSVTLTDIERRCRRDQCLTQLAEHNRASLLLSGDVQSVGPNKNLRVIVRLFDARRRQQQETESLCIDCDETKLGIVLSNTTSDLLLQHRKTTADLVQLENLLDAAAPPNAPLRPVAVSPPVPAAVVPEAATQQQPVAVPVVTPAPPFAPPTAVARAEANAQLASQLASPILNPISPSQLPPRKGLSTKRRAIAGVFGALGFGTLAASVVLTALDKRLDLNYSLNAAGTACQDPANDGKNCVISTVRLWAPGYGLSALLIGGMVLTLVVPENH